MSKNIACKEVYRECLSFYDRPCLFKMEKATFRSFSGVLYCCLTDLRESIYFKINGNSEDRDVEQLTLSMPSTCTSFATRLIMEPLYILLAVASIVELVVRIPLGLIAVGLMKLHELLFGFECMSDWFFCIVGNAAMGIPAALAAAINSVAAIFFNLFDAPIVETTSTYPAAFNQAEMIKTVIFGE